MPTEEHEDLAREADLPAVAANPNLVIGPGGPHYWEQRAEAARRTAREDAQRFAIEAKSREEARQRFAEERAAEAKARAEFQQAATSSAEATTVHVGTDAFVRPAKPQASPSAPADDTTHTSAPTKIPSHNFKKSPQQTNAANQTATIRAAEATAPQRKPPASVTPAPKERKNAAQSLP